MNRLEAWREGAILVDEPNARQDRRQGAGRLYDRFHARLYAYVGSMVADVSACEDVVQEAFLRLLDRAEGPPRSMEAFLFSVARNLALDGFRKASLRQRHGEALQRRASGAGEPDLSALQLRLAREIEALPAEQRETVKLKVFAGLTFPEIGEVLGIPPGTATSRYHAALQRLAERLGGMEDDDEA